jgi:hypothetical protein
VQTSSLVAALPHASVMVMVMDLVIVIVIVMVDAHCYIIFAWCYVVVCEVA